MPKAQMLTNKDPIKEKDNVLFTWLMTLSNFNGDLDARWWCKLVLPVKSHHNQDYSLEIKFAKEGKKWQLKNEFLVM